MKEAMVLSENEGGRVKRERKGEGKAEEKKPVRNVGNVGEEESMH